MSTPFYAWSYTDPVHTIFLGTTSSLAFLSNSLLLYIIRTTSVDGIGSYRYLLAFFAMCNMTTAFGHIFVEGMCHMTTAGFYFWPRKPGRIIHGVSLPSIYCVCYIVTYYQVFLILAYHFVYRYKTVTRGLVNSFTDKWNMKHWIAVAVVIYLVYMCCFTSVVAIGMLPSEETRRLVPAEVRETYGIDLMDEHTGFIVLAVRRVDFATNTTYTSAESVISIICCMILFGGTSAVIIFCIYKTTAAIRSFDDRMTTSSKSMHKQLFRALLIQTSIPCIFSYIPLAMILLLGAITGFSMGSFANVLFLITTIFPALDPLLVLYFIVKFRIAVILLFGLRFFRMRSSSVRTVDSLDTSTRI